MNAEVKELIKKEYIKCATDPIHFFKKYCYISHPNKGRILFHTYDFQEATLELMKINRQLIINKSRQLGISTLVAGYALWLMLFQKDKNIICVATKQETAKNMITKVQFMYDNLPSWLRGNKKPLEQNKLSLRLANGSVIKALAASADAGRSEAVSLLILDEAAFIEDIDKIYTSIRPTISTGGGIVALSSPNGIGNWFHKMYVDAQINPRSEFRPLELKWDVHPERDNAWYEIEKASMSAREFAQEYDCDFLGSGQTVVENDTLSFYEATYIKEPIEKRFMGSDFWIWEYAQPAQNYIIAADVARGDGSDSSAFHVIDIEKCEQVAEYNSQIGTREYAHMLVSVATEYNNALLVIENANIGWDVVNTVIERNYSNLYYSPRSHGDMSMDKYLHKLETEQTVPGFTNSTRTRPLVISKMESYIREKAFIFHSKRLLEQLRVFIWLNGKPQAQKGYNDDLVLAAGIGLYTRDTAAKFAVQGMDLTKAAIGGISKTGQGANTPTIYSRGYGQPTHPYQMNINGQIEDISWVLK